MAAAPIAPPTVPVALIGILHYTGAQLAAIHGLRDLFETAARLAGARGAAARELRVQVLALHGDEPPPAGTPLAALILPPRLDGEPTAAEAAALAPWIRARHREGTRVCSVCAGAFLLAASGLLDGRAATTHWTLAERFAMRFPEVRLDIAKLLIDDGDLLTAGGVMAWTDLGLRLIEQLLGPAVMLATARMFLIDPGEREQRYYSSAAPRLAHGDAAVLRAQQWLAAHFTEPVLMPQLAALAGLGERTFLRRFRAAAGDTPTGYLQQLRVARARELLELSDRPVDAVAWQVGYEDTSAFRRVFQRVVGLAPGAYRQRFAVRQARR